MGSPGSRGWNVVACSGSQLAQLIADNELTRDSVARRESSEEW